MPSNKELFDFELANKADQDLTGAEQRIAVSKRRGYATDARQKEARQLNDEAIDANEELKARLHRAQYADHTQD